jgi:hypothetical protein
MPKPPYPNYVLADVLKPTDDQIGQVGARVSDALGTIGESPYARYNSPGQREQMSDDVMRRMMGAVADPNTPESYRRMLAQLLQGLAQEDRYVGVPAAGEVGPRPPGAR